MLTWPMAIAFEATTTCCNRNTLLLLLLLQLFLLLLLVGGNDGMSNAAYCGRCNRMRWHLVFWPSVAPQRCSVLLMERRDLGLKPAVKSTASCKQMDTGSWATTPSSKWLWFQYKILKCINIGYSINTKTKAIYYSRHIIAMHKPSVISESGSFRKNSFSRLLTELTSCHLSPSAFAPSGSCIAQEHYLHAYYSSVIIFCTYTTPSVLCT